LNAITANTNKKGETMKAHIVGSDGYVFTAARFGGEKDILTLKGDLEGVKKALKGILSSHFLPPKKLAIKSGK